ncbi:MAG: hypothetical protein HYT80_07865 [Euryarchaeota archaeon]|nr:hypothetical protein [Euryarchaeota archaeon]
MSSASQLAPLERFVATRHGEILLAAPTLAQLVQEVERRDLDARTLVIEHLGAPRRARVF